jgi:hypothetical protein
MSCEGMEDTLELCEVFVILGPNEESLSKYIKIMMMDRDRREGGNELEGSRDTCK